MSTAFETNLSTRFVFIKSAGCTAVLRIFPHFMVFNWMWLITFRYRPSFSSSANVYAKYGWEFWWCGSFRHAAHNLFWLLDTENEFVIFVDGASATDRGIFKWSGIKNENVRFVRIACCAAYVDIKTLPVLKMAVGWHEIAEVKGAEQRERVDWNCERKIKKIERETDKETFAEKDKEKLRERKRERWREREWEQKEQYFVQNKCLHVEQYAFFYYLVME